MFLRFAELPAEIRQLIWTFCLLELVPHLFIYKEGFWQFRDLLPHEQEDPTDKVILDFRFDLLRSVQIQSSVPQVNREAYAVATRWARRNHVRVNVSATGSPLSIVLSHEFRPELDILYVSIADLHHFLWEPVLCTYGDNRQGWMSSKTPYFRNLAAALQLWQSDDPSQGFADTLETDYPLLHTIMAVAGDTTDDIESSLDDFWNIRSGWSLVPYTSEDKTDGQNLSSFQDYMANAQKWWVSNNKHPKQLQFCLCRRG